MRLITFQERALLDEVLSKGKARKEYRATNRVKEIDEQYLVEDGNKEYAPIYCFATLRGEVPSLHSLGTNWNYFKGWMNFFGELAMIELEVPEDKILSMKDEFVVDELKGTIYHAHYERIVRERCPEDGKTFECLIGEIAMEHIVAYRLYDTETKYGETAIQTHVINERLKPLWTTPVVFSGDGYIRDYYLYQKYKDEEVPFGYIRAPKSVERNLGKFLPSECYKEFGLRDALLECLNAEAARQWIRLYFGESAEWRDVTTFLKGYGNISMRKAEEILKV